jgi:hypothetical protein
VSRIVVDADGLIKLGKAGVLRLLLGEHEVLVPGAVYEEAVTRGKRELHEEAFGLEAALGGGSAEIFGLEAISAEEEAPSLGPGELDALRVYREAGADAVLSDDRVFLRFLETASVPYLTPAGVVVGFVGSGRLDAGEGFAALDRLGPQIRDEVHRRAREEIQDMMTRRAKEGDE